MKADAIPDGPQILLGVAGDRKTGKLGEATALFEDRGDLAQELRGLRDLEVTAAHLRPGDAADRKSTRLNSSHQIISYAVFCLKKKKQEIHQLHSHIEHAS